MEWNGFEHDMARNLPSQLGANFNTLTLIQKSLYDIGMVHEHIFIDVQLFAATKQVCWYKSKQFQNGIVRLREFISYNHSSAALPIWWKVQV